MGNSKYLILGGGMAAGYAAKQLIEGGLKAGDLAIVSADDALPYERPPLSKGYLAGKDDDSSILINSREAYKKHGVSVTLLTTIQEIELSKRQLRATSGETFGYEKLLIATGARARTLDVPGRDLPDVFYLRSMGDSRKIRASAERAKRAVVIGGGFIGMEVASVLAQKKVHVTMVVPEERVWARVFTPEMSAFFEGYYRTRGVEILTKQSVTELKGRGRVESAALKSGSALECDLVVAGVGAAPEAGLAEKAGLAINNGITVNEYLESSAPDVFAAGDVANYPDKIFEKRRRVEHWDNAVAQGQHWAALMAGDRKPFVHVPYFFSDVFDLSYELWGDAEGATKTVTRGDVKKSSFSVWWLKDDCLVAAFAMNRPDGERQAAAAWIASKQKISVDRLADERKAIEEASAK